MYKRKTEDILTKQAPILKKAKEAIVIKGPRQVGKTTIALKYARTNYKNVIYVNFMDKPQIKSVFNGELNVETIIRGLSAYIPNSKFEPFKTIIVLDEVQECANARYSIKPFMEDGRYDVIATGSLLGIKGYSKMDDIKIPVGYESTFYMSSLDFEEYIMAKGIDLSIIEYLKDSLVNLKKIDDAIHKKMLDLFNEYIIVGGMPRVVSIFLENNDLNLTRKIKRDILETYKDDFGKHLNELEKTIIKQTELNRILAVYKTLPFQLAKENKKFQYSGIKKGARSSEYYEAISWLEEAGLVKVARNLTSIDLPFNAYANENEFKLYFFDSGLFISMLDDEAAKDILNGNLGIYKGAIFENAVADCLGKKQLPLYYYSKNSGLELDFLVRYKNDIIPLEVKAKDGNAKSLKTVLNDDKYNLKYGIKLSKNNLGISNKIITIPYYLVSFLELN